tara:strand:+ start:15782 stop:15982 length:201 start_codon:yes stop_codon:yes gene_type:complete
MGEKGSHPMSNKKDDDMLPNLNFSDEDLQTASEMIEIIEEALAYDYPEIKFQDLLFWWLASAPADA